MLKILITLHFAITIVHSKLISNFTTYNPMLIPYGNYTKLRIHGFGKGNDQAITTNQDNDDVELSNLELGAEWVSFNVAFHSWHDRILNRLFIRKFDVFIFTKESDYNCYQHAVRTLIESNERVSC